jgi:hypothetical protein
MTRSLGREMMPSETMRVVAPAGGWLTRNRTINAPVAESESAAAKTVGPWKPVRNAKGGLEAIISAKAA